MRLRTRLLLLLAAASVIPAGVVGWVHHRAMNELGADLARRNRADLLAAAESELSRVAGGFARVTAREKQLLELAAEEQARAAESALAGPAMPTVPVHWEADFDADPSPVPGLRLDPRRRRVASDGTGVPLRTSRDAMVCRAPAGTDPAALRADAGRLSTLVSHLQSIADRNPELVMWQNITLDSGLHTSWPGHGAYPEGYDARERRWYRTLRASDRITWAAPTVDATSRTLLMTVGRRIRRGAGGEAVGVSAIDVPLGRVLKSEALSAWWDEVHSRLVNVGTGPADPSAGGAGQADVYEVARRSYGPEGSLLWDRAIEIEPLPDVPPADRQALRARMSAGATGVARIRVDDTPSLAAWAPITDDGAFLLLIVPEGPVTARARRAEDAVLERTSAALEVTFGAAALLLVLALAAAAVVSRTVTRPVVALVDTIRRIGDGDLEARAVPGGSRETRQLADTVNAMVPQLRDRLHLRESLALAMEVQQHLLPAGPPDVPGLDVAGLSDYCDETGGDYYDFLDIAGPDDLGGGRAGIAIGDVAGHGIAAALLMTTARAVLRSHADETGSLADLIGTVNRHLAADAPGGRFMTLFQLVVDVQAGEMRWVSAGHDPAVQWDPDTDTFTEHAGDDPPLGIDGTREFSERSAPLPRPGGVILLGTDGIWEARNAADEMFGRERTRAVLREAARRTDPDGAPASSASIARAIHDAVAAHRGDREQEDDITLVVLRVT